MPRPFRDRRIRGVPFRTGVLFSILAALPTPLAAQTRPDPSGETGHAAASARIPGEPPPLAITRLEAELAGDSLAAYWTTGGLFDDAARRALESGVGAEIRFTIELWKSRRFWFNGVETGKSIRWLASLDRRGRRLVLIGDGGTFRGFEDVGGLESFLSYPAVASLVPVADLSPGNEYYLSAKVEVTPLTLEAIRRVEYWMRGGDGGMTGTGLPGSGITRRLFGLVSDLSGFGDRVAGARTPKFRLNDLSTGTALEPAGP